DEVTVGVECLAGTDEVVPPARRGMSVADAAARVRVAGERVAHEHRVARGVVELAPGLVGHGDVVERTASLERERVVGGDGDELAVTDRIARAPRTGRGKVSGERARVLRHRLSHRSSSLRTVR